MTLIIMMPLYFVPLRVASFSAYYALTFYTLALYALAICAIAPSTLYKYPLPPPLTNNLLKYSCSLHFLLFSLFYGLAPIPSVPSLVVLLCPDCTMHSPLWSTSLTLALFCGILLVSFSLVLAWCLFLFYPSPYRPLFLSQFSQVLAFWGSSHFGRSKLFISVFCPTYVSVPYFYLYTQSREFYATTHCAYHLIKGNKLEYFQI